ncbi:MAG: NAD(+)/NADH kinase [Holophagaceae bacterium]|nr:NAD(+)/NADH kinase [Holophagaceae bacterium]
MSLGKLPRVVLVTRPTDYQALLVAHGTREQARFILEDRGQRIEEVEARHHRFEAALAAVLRAVPLKWRRSMLDRSDLSAFVFEPEDLVVALGQDGLVANVAKYLDGQRVLGINPDPEWVDGMLVKHPPEAAADLIQDAAGGRVPVEARTMVEARLEDGQRLLALNEVFLGHRSHQSARYRLRQGDREERQSSSGLIVATGTGSTGWARSIHLEHHSPLPLPSPTDPRLVYFVREAFPSRGTGTSLTEGLLPSGGQLQVISEMNEDGVLFGDGMEADCLPFPWGATATIQEAPERLNLI